MQPSPAVVLLLHCVLALTGIAHSKSVKPASTYFTLCSRSETKALNECLKKSFTDMLPTLKKGIQALELTPLDPLNIPTISFSDGSGNFGLKTTLTNFTTNGIASAVITNVNAVIEKNKLMVEMSMTVPRMDITSNYDMSGQILVIPVKGVGAVEFNLTDLLIATTCRGNIVKRGGEEWVDLEDFKFVTDLEGTARVWFQNLFNGDKRLGDATNNLLNDNYKEAYQAYKHLLEEGYQQVFKDMATKVFNAFPVKALFLD